MTEPTATAAAPVKLTRKDFAIEDQKWCLGCGEYSIPAQTQNVLPGVGIPK
jgi:2-oxoglutarate ferredoxin oxidoreductase subunit beta